MRAATHRRRSVTPPEGDRIIVRRALVVIFFVAPGLAHRPAEAQIPVLATWNPGASVGEWEVKLFWVYAPDPTVQGSGLVGPDNDGNYTYLVLIPSGRCNLATFKTVTSLDVGTLGELDLSVGTLQVIAPSINNGLVRIQSAGGLTVTDFENIGSLEMSSLGKLFAGNFNNHGTVTIDVQASISAVTVNNFNQIDLNTGVTTLTTGFVNNEGKIDTARVKSAFFRHLGVS